MTKPMTQALPELSLLKGTISQLQLLQREGVGLFQTEKGKNVVGAMGVATAAIGAFAQAGMLASHASNSISVQYFTCSVNGIEVSGYFEAILFDNGEAIEFVVEYNPANPQEAIAHASRSPQDRILCVRPHQQRGHISAKRLCRQMAFWFPVSVMVLMIIFNRIVCWEEGSCDKGFLYIMAAITGGGGALLSTIIFLVGIYDQRDARHASRVIGVLGYDNPAEVDLHDKHFDAARQWSKQYDEETDPLFGGTYKWVYRY